MTRNSRATQAESRYSGESAHPIAASRCALAASVRVQPEEPNPFKFLRSSFFGSSHCDVNCDLACRIFDRGARAVDFRVRVGRGQAGHDTASLVLTAATYTSKKSGAVASRFVSSNDEGRDKKIASESPETK